MQLHPWIITSWPTVEQHSRHVLKIATDLQHFGTVVSGDCDEFGRLLGHTIWGQSDMRIGVAWDWTEALDGIFALSDPMGVVSNIEFVDDNGVGLHLTSTAVQLNRIAHSLAWQVEVSKVTRSLRKAAPWSRRIKAPTDLHFRASELGGLSSFGRVGV